VVDPFPQGFAQRVGPRIVRGVVFTGTWHDEQGPVERLVLR